MSTRHNYTNPAFCQKSEFYQISPKSNQPQSHATTASTTANNNNVNNSKINVNLKKNDGVGVRRIQRSVSTRSFHKIYNNNNNGSVGGGSSSSSNSNSNSTNIGNGNLNSSMRCRQETNVRNLKQTRQFKEEEINERQDGPKPGPKPRQLEPTKLTTSQQRSDSGRYALVPVEELSNVGQDRRYAIIPGPVPPPLQQSHHQTPPPLPSTLQPQALQQRFTKSQDNLDRYSNRTIHDEPLSIYHDDENDDTFISLPPMPQHRRQLQSTNLGHDDHQPRMKAAFSSDFGSKSFVLVDQKNNQRYAVVPTADDEDIVDDNHEIIQMLNGRAHRYAVIPTADDDSDGDDSENDEEETCLSTSDLNQNYSIIHDINNHRQLKSLPLETSTPQKIIKYQQQQPQQHSVSNPCTPNKNSIAATKKLHELLSTPRRKTPNIQQQSPLQICTPPPVPVPTPTPTPIHYKTNNQNSRRYKSQQQIYMSEQSIRQELTPQRLQYDTKQAAYLEARTTAIIQPRQLVQSNQLDDNNCDGDNSNNFYNDDKSWNNSYPQKVANATATLGVVSFMLIIGSLLNSGLCLYLIANAGRSFFLEFALTAAFAGVGLGILGFRSRHCEWLPNRSYISGYILVTVFCLLKCCALLVLLVLDPYPGMPLHDVTTGIILGLSTFTIFFIGLGVLGSYWCYRPPPDNRVNVY